MSIIDQIADSLVRACQALGGLLTSTFLHRTSLISLWSLLSALLIIVIWLVARQHKQPSLRFAGRVVLPKGYLTNQSAKADWLLFVANHGFFPLLFGAAILASSAISGPVCDALVSLFGSTPLELTPTWIARCLTTCALFLAYEFAYFSQHYLSHRIPLLWHFHKVHHSATSLSPFTNFRVHPFDSVTFANALSLCLGTVAGFCAWLFGAHAKPFAIDGTNVLMVIFVYSLLHLQHSQLWIVFKGRWSRFFMSPAAHQIHHSRNPDHFNCNYGNALAVWDRVFGTYRQPSDKSMRLKFGVDGLDYDPHGIYGTVFAPVIEAWRSVWPQRSLPNPARAAASLQTTTP